MQTFVLASKSSDAITCTATAADFGKDIGAFREIVETFKIDDED